MGTPSVAREAARLAVSFGGAAGGCGRVVVAWTLAGGVFAGGFALGALVLGGVVEPGFHLLLAPVLFLGGALVGLGQGLGLALAGRAGGLAVRDALRRAGLGVAAALPLMTLAWVVTAGITVGSTLRDQFRVDRLVVSGGAAVFGLALCGWAALEAFAQIRALYRRCRAP